MIYEWLRNAQLRLLPPLCVLCRAPGAHGLDLCPACRAELPRLGASCSRCASPLPPGAVGVLCGACQRSPPPWQALHAPYAYTAPLDRLLPALKFGGRLSLARLLGELLAAHVAAGAERPELILPVPLHPSRLRERGYNQALELARPVALALRVPLEVHACRRVRATAAQTGLTLKARRSNLRGAFEVTPTLGVRHVAVVDDVVTSGSTVAELTRALARAGVQRVDVWAVARAIKG